MFIITLILFLFEKTKNMSRVSLIFIFVLFTSQYVVEKFDTTPIIDSNTFSNYNDVTVLSYHLDWTLDFDSQNIYLI